MLWYFCANLLCCAVVVVVCPVKFLLCYLAFSYVIVLCFVMTLEMSTNASTFPAKNNTFLQSFSEKQPFTTVKGGKIMLFNGLRH